MQLGAASFAHVPKLVELSLRSNDLRLTEPLVLPELARLSVRVEQPAVEQARVRGRANVIPPLSDPDFHQLWSLFDGSGLPSLVELSLALDSSDDRVITELLFSRMLDQLAVLRLEHVGELGAAAICQSPQRFAKLATFEVFGIQLPEPLVAALRALGCSVKLTPARTS
jgi:hypothetical protein